MSILSADMSAMCRFFGQLMNRFQSIFGLEYFFVDRQGMNLDTYRNPLLFRKDGKPTIQPRKVTYDLDGNAEFAGDPEVRWPRMTSGLS